MADEPKPSDPVESAISAAGAAGRKRRPPTLDLTATDTTPASETNPPPPDAVTESPIAAEAVTVPPAADAGSPTADASASTKFSFAPDGGSADTASPEPFAAGDQLPPPPSSSNSSTLPPPNRSSFGGALAAGALGAVLMLLVLGMLWVAGLFGGDSTMLADRTNRLETQLRSLSDRPAATSSAPAFDSGKLDELTKRLAAIESNRPIEPTRENLERISRLMVPGTLAARVDTLESAVKLLSGRLDATANTARETAQAQSAQAPTVPPAEIEALNTRIATLDSGIKSLQADVTKRFASGITDPAARRAVTAEALRVAVERGEALVDQLKAAQPLAGGSTLAPLQPFAQQGVPTAAALARELNTLLPALRGAQPLAPSTDSGFMQKLASNAEKLVRVRPVNEVAGDDPAATLSRVEVRAQQNDIDGALAELNKLPADSRGPAAAWMQKAQARRDAVQAARQFAGASLNQLTPDSSSTR